MQSSVVALKFHWEELKNAMAARGKALEDKWDFLEFLQKVEEVEVWIRQKVRREGWMDKEILDVYPV